MKTAQRKIREQGKLYGTNIIFIIFIIFISFIFVSTTTVYAQTSRSFTISPPTIKFSLKPGKTAEKVIKITNNSSQPLEFVANVVDFIVTDKDGTPELLPAGVKMDNKFAASYWTTVIPDAVVVPAGKTGTVTLYLQVPGDARPGGRYVSVAFRPSVVGGQKDTTGASVNAVAGSLVYVTVQGKMQEGARVDRFSAPLLSEYGPVDIATEIKNTGDLHINPKGTIVVRDLLGRKVYSSILKSLNVFPGTSRIFENKFEKKLLFGRFVAKLDGYYGTNENLPLTAKMAFWVIPYKLILIVLLAVGLAVWFSRFMQKRQEELMEVKEEEETAPKKK